MVLALSGKQLAESAHLHVMYRDRYRSGVAIDDLVRELESAGIAIAGDDPWSTLRSALNAAQDRWVHGSDGTWIPIPQKQPVGTELSGRALSDAIYAFVQVRYPIERVFHYEQAKEELLRTGVRIKQERATQLVLEQAEVLSQLWAVA